MRGSLIALMAVLSAVAVSPEAFAKSEAQTTAKHSWKKPRPRVDRDCTPINGRFGYYGNPWCDTGSSRPPDVDFRERQRARRQ